MRYFKTVLSTPFVKLVSVIFLCASAGSFHLASAASSSEMNTDGLAYEKIDIIKNAFLSPDAKRLYTYRATSEGVKAIIRVDVESGQEEVLLEPLHGSVSFLGFGPNEQQLFFVADAVGNELYKLHILNIETGRYLVATPRDSVDLPCAFSPDAKYIYAARGTHNWGEKRIVRITVATGDSQTVYDKDKAILGCQDISKDGKRLIIDQFISNDEQHLAILDLETGEADWVLNESKVTASEGMFYRGMAYFISNSGSGVSRIWRVDPNSEVHAVALPIQADIESFTLTDNGLLSVIYRSGLFGAKNELFKIQVTGEIAAVPLTVEVEKVREIITADVHAERYVIAMQNGKPAVWRAYEAGKTKTLIDTDQSGLPDEAFAHFQSFMIKSFDGLEIPTHILVPAGASVETPLPMLVWIHGGPEDHEDPNYSGFLQRIANRGFVLVVPNVRGSSGFGKKFMNMDNGDWGGAHIRDILAVADFAAELDFVRDKPRFILGGSFGGFSVLSMISQYPDAFDAAIDIFGIADIQSFIASMPEGPKGYFISELGFDPVKEPEKARAVSPLHHADSITIPLQVHQGIHDPRVLPEQSRVMVKALQKRGLPVEYFEYDEGHGFAKKENDMLSRERIVNFLERQRALFVGARQGGVNKVISTGMVE